MNVRFNSEEDFTAFKQHIKELLKNHSPRKIEKPDFRKSAVMMLIMNKNNEACVLVTKRTLSVSSHKGQMSLPGGRYEESDGNLLATALRETHEEVGIPQSDIEVLGQFDEFLSIAGYHVESFIGAVKYPYQYTINRHEIDDYVEVPLSIFTEKRYDKIQQVEYEGRKLNIYYYFYNGFEIWGLTARILTDFALKILNGCGQTQG